MLVMPSLETEGERIVYDRKYWDRSVELAGCWAHIHLVSKESCDSDSRMWGVVMDHVKFVGNATSPPCLEAGKCGGAIWIVAEHGHEVQAGISREICSDAVDADR